ncbi:unnamed protein product, partial [Rotaria sp. Silwood2]
HYRTSPLQQLIENHRDDPNGIFNDNIVNDVNICLLAEESRRNTHRWRTLNLWNNNIGPDGAVYINQILQNSKLTSLHLGRNYLRSKGLAKLNALNKHHYLTELVLWDNKIDDEGIEALATLLPTTILRKLNLGTNDIGDKGCQVLFANLPPSLIYLDLFANKISEKCLQSILEAIPKSRLQELNLQHQQVDRWSQKSQEDLKRVGQYNSCQIII